jgi:16S rRNA (guanine527-N7)-methyltransferase
MLVEHLLRWNAHINLIAPGDEAVIWDRHIHDSLQLVPLIPRGADRAIDLGSGAGFPGLVLAIATGIRWELIEADQRKASFLREAARLTGAPVRVHPIRAERARLPRAPLVTARGFARLSAMVQIAAGLLSEDGVCLFPKGASATDELTEARRKWQMSVDQLPSQTAGGGTILIVRRIAPSG